MRRFGRWIARLFAFAAVAGVVLAWGYRNFTAPGPLETAAAFVVPKGLGVDGIAALLEKDGVVANARVFAIGVRIFRKHRALPAGEFLFAAHSSARDAMETLINAKPVVRRFTVAEGLTSEQIVKELNSAKGLEGIVKEKPEEGGLLPETYNYSWGDGRGELVTRMHRAMSETMDRLWQERAPDLPLHSMEEALTLASIVEKETGKAEERPHIAAVFLNRLRLHMRLQSDPTVVYAITHGEGPLGRPLTHDDLAIQSRYNTYLNDGLPPGPIANPGKAAIAAVLHPMATNDLYFVADGTGGHAFAKSLAEHNRNVVKLRKLQGQSNGEKPK